MSTQDEAAVFRFDTRLEESMPFTSGLRTLPPTLATLRPFGATSLLDAIARTAERVGQREKAVVARSWCSPTASTTPAV